MSFTPDVVRVVVDGHDFTRWSDYTLSSNVFMPPASFSMTMGRVDKATRDLLQNGVPVEIYIDVNGEDQLRLTGHVNERQHSYGAGEHSLTIMGYDRGHELQVSAVALDLKVKDRIFVDVVADAISPWGMIAYFSNEADRYVAAKKANWKKILGGMSKSDYHAKIKALQKQHGTKAAFVKACQSAGIKPPPHVHDGIMRNLGDAKVKPGETVWQFIERIAAHAELMPFFTPDGMLCIQRPNYDQDPQYILSHRPSVPSENNVKSVRETRSIDGIPTELTVHGKTRKVGKKREAVTYTESSLVMLDAVNAYGLYRPGIRKDTTASDEADCAARAYRAMKDAEKNAHRLTYVVAGHSQAGVVWTPDTTVQVVDEVLDINDVFYVEGVVMRRGRTRNAPQPQETEITLQPLYTWVPADE